MDIRSEIGEFNNVPLYLTKTIQTKLNSDNTTAYTIDEYQFNFSFNFAQSSQFSETLKYREFGFNISPMFNQNVIKDFSVEANTKDIQELIKEMNLNQNVKTVIYANNMDIVTGQNLLKLNSMNSQQQQSLLEVYVYPPQNSRPYVNLVEFKALTSSFNLLQADFKIASLNESVEFKLVPTLYQDSQVILQIPFYIYLNKVNKFEIDQANQNKGLFAVNSNQITLTGTIKFEYQKLIRTVNLNQTFFFNQQSTSSLFAKVSFDRECVFAGNYMELENEKVF